MDRTTQTMIATVVAIAMMVGWLLTGCSNEEKVSIVQFEINDIKIEHKAAASIHDGRLMVPASSIEEIFNKKLEWQIKSASKETAYYSKQVAVLMYHDMAVTPQSDGIIAVDRFEKQMSMLKQHGFHVISIEEYANFMLGNGEVPDNAVMITFDDGYESFYKLAYPILMKYGYPATNFVIVSAIDDRTREGTPKLTWEQMREMQQNGMSFRNHTYDMHVYKAMNKEGKETPVTVRPIYNKGNQRVETKKEYNKRIMDDLLKAEERLRRELGNTQSALAFPYGAYNTNLLEIVNAVDIPISFSTKEGINSKLHRLGYRINGARSGETEAELIEKLKQLGDRTEKGSDSMMLFIDGQEISDINFSLESHAMEPMISVREFCEKYEWTVAWNKAKNQVEIKTLQSPNSAVKD